MDTRHAVTPQEATDLASWLVGLTLPFTMTVSEGKLRSLSQNSLLHKWFGEISAQSGDMTDNDVKGECHHKYGLPIRLVDPQFSWVWERTGAKFSYEKQCSLLASGTLGISSKMKSPQLKKYMDAMNRDYTQRGLRLTQPEARK